MKRIIVAMAAIAAAFTMASCNKEQFVEPENNITPTEGNCIITASTESTLTKTSLEGDDTNGYDVVWSEGDKIKIGGNEFTLTEGANTTTGKFQGTLPEGDGPFTAYYPATYNGTDWPAKQTYAEGNITGSPMIAEVVKGAESFSFMNKGGILRLTLKGTAKVGSIKVSAIGLDEIVLNCGSGVTLDNTNGTVFHIAMPEGNYSGVSIAVWTPDYDNCTKKLKEGTQLNIVRSQITTASFTAEFPSSESTDPLNGVFSVSASKQVSFSRGNLRYTVASTKWSFYDKQYKCGPLHEVDSKEISLFTWGYNATQSIKPIGSASNNVSITSGNLSSTQDWGSVIGDGKTWRTLTSAEWTYLFKGRPDASQKYGYATVGGQKGLIILPDVFIDPMKNGGSSAFKPQSSTASNWTDNYYTLAGNWEAMEAAGAVFLPAAGRRGGNSIATGSNEQGHYWSSSAADSDKAYFVYFNDNSFAPAYSWSRGAGCSVRLVTDLYIVTFDMNGKIGTEPESLKGIKYGSKITKPSDPTTIIGCEFAGWYKDKACTNEWNFGSDVVVKDITLYAKWNELPIRAIQGKFTVSAEGKQVCFSKGNLIATIDATGAPTAWKFAANQYDFLGRGGANETIGTAAGDIDLFAWSTVVSKYGTNLPGSDDITAVDFVDWGTAIDNKGTWRTLSKEEWNYLLSNRTMTNGKDRFNCDITYCGKKGVVLYPDDYDGEAVSSTTTVLPEGVVFLPYAGYRYGDCASYVNERGLYWTASSKGDEDAYYMYFTTSTLCQEMFRVCRNSVRLVTDLN